ncbi:MAG: glycosyltransferase family 2 protein [Bacilli bacterium]
MNFIIIICLILILSGLTIIIIKDFLCRNNNNVPVIRSCNNHKFCILIPARDESKVIKDLLKSIKSQTYKVPMNDVYVIVEDEKDKTVKICDKYKATVIVRKHLNLKRKGYALDEAVKDILKKGKKYDAYFIFDADNVLDKHFIENMISTYDNGYDLASGYRNVKNGDDSVVATTSSLMFSLINTIFNNRKIKETRNITFSGTGFYVTGSLIESWGGYPFHSLTEDYELSLYAILNNLTTYYNFDAVFYDEQPVKYKQTVPQRIRWIRGFFDTRRKYVPLLKESAKVKSNNHGSKIDEIIGIIQYVLIVVGLILWLLSLLVMSVYALIIKEPYINFILQFIFLLFLIYLVLFIITFIIIYIEKDKLKISLKSRIKALFYNPLFMFTYVPCAVKALLKKEVKWEKTEHGINEK